MIIAITGGTGFIGKRLTERLATQGHELRVLTRDAKSSPYKNLKFYKGDLNKQSSLKEFLNKADVLFHCAGETKNFALMKTTHITGTQNLLDAASGKIKKWVQLSSVGVYGKTLDNPVVESTPYNPINLYETTKTEADKLVLNATREGKIDSIILRPSNVYGPEMTAPYIYKLIAAVDKGYFFFIGKKGAIMNNIHVNNLVDALILCANTATESGKIYNLSDELPIEDYMAIIAQQLGKRPPRFRLPKIPLALLAKALELFETPLTNARIDALSKRNFYSSELIKKELNYQHAISLKEGLIEMVNHYKKRENYGK